MPKPLESRVFSSSSLLAGVSLVQSSSGMDSLEGMAVAEMEEELMKLEVNEGVGHGKMF